MKIVSLLLLAVLLSIQVNAQSGVNVSGTLEDQTEAVIPGGMLTLTSKANGQARQTTANGEGRFSFAGVTAGEYVLRGEAEGFKRLEMPVTVAAQPVNNLQVKMAIHNKEEVVSVSASGSRPDSPENNNDSYNINVDFINALPTQSQDILTAVGNYLSPAAQGVEGTSIVVDGVESSSLTQPTDSLKRIYINHDPYSAEFRRPGSGRVEVTTRNGSRGHFDGNLAFYDRNDIFDAKNAFADTKPNLDRHLWEATLGGPLPFRRARFFLSASRLVDNEDAIVNAITPQGPLLQNVPLSQNNTNVIGRADFRPTEDNTLSVSYTFHTNPQVNRGVGGLRLAQQATSSRDTENTFKLWNTTVVTPALLNVVRFSYQRENERIGLPASGPELEVSGAFTGGPNQSSSVEHGTRMEIQDILNYVSGQNTVRLGGAFLPKSFDFTDSTNFGGIFTFANLGAFSANTPVLFQIARGNPEISFDKNEAYGFFQDEIKIQQHTTLMVGIRYDWQQRLSSVTHFAPRIAYGYAPGKGNTVFRAGAGIFYDRLSDHVVEQTLLLNGTQEQEFIIRNPGFPSPLLNNVPASIWQLGQNIQTPYLVQASASVEHSLNKSMKATLEYRYLHGVHLFRAIDVNAPLAGGGRPDGSLFLDRQVQSSALLRSNALIASLQGRMFRALKLKAQYTFSKSEDNTEGPLSLPANSRDLGPEWGRSDFDMRHRLVLSGTSDLPANFRMGVVLVANSGRPFDITTGSDDNHDGTVNDRPASVTRNTGDGPGFVQTDLRLTKVFNFYKSGLDEDGGVIRFSRMELSFDAFNLFNHTNRTDIVGDISSPRFGLAATALQSRTIQLSIKFGFRKSME
jgi:hypothetical protein